MYCLCVRGPIRIYKPKNRTRNLTTLLETIVDLLRSLDAGVICAGMASIYLEHGCQGPALCRPRNDNLRRIRNELQIAGKKGVPKWEVPFASSSAAYQTRLPKMLSTLLSAGWALFENDTTTWSDRHRRSAILQLNWWSKATQILMLAWRALSIYFNYFCIVRYQSCWHRYALKV